jgi:hypothetical protein
MNVFNMKPFFWSLLILVGSLVACQNASSDSNDSSTTAEEQAAQNKQSGEEILAELKEQAVSQGDFQGRLQTGINVLQQKYNDSEGQMPGIKSVEVTIDENCMLTISNQADGGSMVKVDLHKLDKDGFSLIPDRNEGEYPGLRIRTIGDEAAVAYYEGGQLKEMKDELVIFLADRDKVGQITPAILQTVNLCQGGMN